MTKEELEEEAYQYDAEHLRGARGSRWYHNVTIKEAYLAGAEPREKQIEATYKVVEKLNEAKEILKVVLNKWKEDRWILQSEKEVKMIENVMKEAEQFLKED